LEKGSKDEPDTGMGTYAVTDTTEEGSEVEGAGEDSGERQWKVVEEWFP
jgi:hypothetical protein